MVINYLYNFPVHINKDISIFLFLYAGDVRFSLRGTIYQNNSIVTLEDIGNSSNAALCMTNLTTCCRHPYTGINGSAIGNWFFPNGTRVLSHGSQWDFYRIRGQMVVGLNRRRGGVDGIYRCEIPYSASINQTIYIGVYSTSTGEIYSSMSFKFKFDIWVLVGTCCVLAPYIQFCTCNCEFLVLVDMCWLLTLYRLQQ